MDIQTFAGISHTLQTLVVASLVLAICLALPKLKLRSQLAKLPAFDKGGEKHRNAYLQSAKRMYMEGFAKFKDSAWRITGEDGGENVIIAPQFLSELRKLPDSVLSFPKAIEKSMEIDYTKILSDEPIIPHAIKADLTPALARLNSVVFAEVEQALQEEMPDCKDWTPVSIYMKLVNMIAKITGRVFVGPELCRDQDYLDSAIRYTMDVIEVVHAVKKIRPWLRPYLAPRLAEVKRLREREAAATRFLEPIVRARQEAEANDPNWEKPDDMLQWFMNRKDDYGITSTAHLAKLQLGIIFAAIHTTTLTTTNILYNLAVSPEYVEPLRDEVRSAMAESGNSITTRTLQQMVKLDSYMKETMRFYPPGLTSFSRAVLRGFTLSNGQYIPPGVVLEVPSHAIYQTTFPDGDKFDGFRHARLREGGGATDHAKNMFVTTNESNLMFGYGRHACPGRFFAANEIKMLLARLLLDFEFKNEGDSQERYPNMEMGRQSSPDARRNLMFKRVSA